MVKRESQNYANDWYFLTYIKVFAEIKKTKYAIQTVYQHDVQFSMMKSPLNFTHESEQEQDFEDLRLSQDLVMNIKVIKSYRGVSVHKSIQIEQPCS